MSIYSLLVYFLYVCNVFARFLFGKCEFINQICDSAADALRCSPSIRNVEKEAFSNENC